MDHLDNELKVGLLPTGGHPCLPRRFSAAMFALLLAHGAMAAGLADSVKRTLLTRTDPEYPVMARQMHVEGAVVLQITIEPDGHVSNARLARGSAMLAEAAKAAVKRWKYDSSAESTTAFVRVIFSLQ